MYILKFISKYLRSQKKIIIFLCVLMLTFILFFWNNILITVLPGHNAVKFSRFWGGVVMDRVYTPGMHLVFPWDTLTIYNTRIQEKTQTINVLTSNGLNILVVTSLRYQLIADELPILHTQIGSEFGEVILKPVVTSVIRKTLGQFSLESIYAPEVSRILEDSLTIRTVMAMSKIPINIQDFVIKEIILPPSLAKSIENKVIEEQNLLKYQYILEISVEEAKRLNIEGEGIKRYQQLVNANMTNNFLHFESIKAQTRLATSQNAKMVILGKNGNDGEIPLILNMNEANTTEAKVNEQKTPQNVDTVQENIREKASNISPENAILNAKTITPTTLESFKNFMKRLDLILQN